MIFNLSETNSGGGGEDLITISCSDPNASFLGGGWEYDDELEEWYFVGDEEQPFPVTITPNTYIMFNTTLENVTIINSATRQEMPTQIVYMYSTRYYLSPPPVDIEIVSADDL